MIVKNFLKLNKNIIKNNNNKLFSTSANVDGLTAPHGGKLINKMVNDDAEKAKIISSANKVVEVNERQSCDIELIMNGGFSPLEGFMNQDDYTSVVENMRLKNNLLFGLPVVLDTYDDSINVGDKVLLRWNNTDMAVIDVEDKYQPSKEIEALNCYGTSSIEHPGVRLISMERGPTYLGGNITGLNIPERVFYCATPQEVRDMLPKNKDVVAFQNRNPIHRAHYELFMKALDAPNVNKDGAVVLVHPTCGPTQGDDIPGNVRYLTYEVLKKELEEQGNQSVKWAYLPYSMHMAGPREAIQHSMIRKNFGCTHFIIGRDMAGSKSSVTGDDYYGPYEAQELAIKCSDELGIQMVPSLNLVYTKETDSYITADEAKEKGYEAMKLSGTEFRRKLRSGEDIPEWFAFKSVVEVLRANN